MDSHPSRAGCKLGIRPPPCPICFEPCWWDGWRQVTQMVIGADESVKQIVEQRHRARCKDPMCSNQSWTVYEAGAYPHRTFTLEVTAKALSALSVVPDVSLAAVAKQYQCDPRTVGRWRDWVDLLVNPLDLSRLCSRLDPEGCPPPQQDVLAMAGFLVLLLENLAKLLREQGVPLQFGSGLAAILRHQFDRFRALFWLTRDSPPLQLEGAMAEV